MKVLVSQSSPPPPLLAGLTPLSHLPLKLLIRIGLYLWDVSPRFLSVRFPLLKFLISVNTAPTGELSGRGACLRVSALHGNGHTNSFVTAPLACMQFPRLAARWKSRNVFVFFFFFIRHLSPMHQFSFGTNWWKEPEVLHCRKVTFPVWARLFILIRDLRIHFLIKHRPWWKKYIEWFLYNISNI